MAVVSEHETTLESKAKAIQDSEKELRALRAAIEVVSQSMNYEFSVMTSKARL